MPMETAPQDRLIILFESGSIGVVGRWDDKLGWIARYKDVDERHYIAKLNPKSWIPC